MILPSKEFLEVFKKTEGALSVTESIAIMNIAAQAPIGTYIELGTYKGKSAMSASYCLLNKVTHVNGDIHDLKNVVRHTIFTLVDPIFKDGGIVDEVAHTLSSADDLFIYRFNFLTSIECLQEIKGIEKIKYSYVFVDSGSHQDGLPMQEVRLLEDRLVQNGIIAFHDFRSQFIEVEQAYNYLLSTGKYEEIKIDWQPIIDYVNENNLEEGNVSWHHNELKNPCFVGALKRKKIGIEWENAEMNIWPEPNTLINK